MSEVFQNPLHDLHRQAEAEFQGYGPFEVVSTFGEPQAEYAAIRKACGMIDQPQRGFLELTGADRFSFLNNILTNQTWDKQTKTGMQAGRGVYALLLQAKSGKIIVDLNVLELGQRTLIELDARLIAPTKAAIERYLFTEKVVIRDVSALSHQIALHGPGAQDILTGALDNTIKLETQLSCASARMLGGDLMVWRDDVCGVPGFHLIVPADAARAIWMHFLTRFGAMQDVGKRPLRAVGWAAFNAARIEAGRPIFGIDFDETTLPVETGPLFSRGVSFTKGCYPGQEIVARMHARGQIPRQLAGIAMEADALPIAGTEIFDSQQNQVGVVTSSTISPVLSGRAIALGLLKRPHFKIGTALHIPAEGAIRNASVVALPFLGNMIPPNKNGNVV